MRKLLVTIALLAAGITAGAANAAPVGSMRRQQLEHHNRRFCMWPRLAPEPARLLPTQSVGTAAATLLRLGSQLRLGSSASWLARIQTLRSLGSRSRLAVIIPFVGRTKREFDTAGPDGRRAFPLLSNSWTDACLRKPEAVGDEALVRSFSKFDEDAIRIAHERHFVQYLAIDGEARPLL